MKLLDIVHKLFSKQEKPTLKRYLPKSQNDIVSFGEGTKIHTWDFDWYFGENKIGLGGQNSCESESFLGGILAENEDALLVISAYENTSFSVRRRIRESTARIDGNNARAGQEQTKALVDLIKSSNTIHAYFASKPKNDGTLLVFSTQPPPLELYDEQKPIPIYFRSEYF